MDRHLADDLIEAAECAGARAKRYGPMATGTYGVSIGEVPDVDRLVRSLRGLGVGARLSYNAGTGWKLVDEEGSHRPNDGRSTALDRRLSDVESSRA